MYRSQKWSTVDNTVQEGEFSGTYYCPINVATGLEGQTAQVLYDSANYVGGRMGGGTDPLSGAQESFIVGSPARPDSAMEGPLIHGVDVGIYMHREPSAWVAGGVVYLGARIIVAEQDVATGVALLDSFYTMWQNYEGDAYGEPAIFANGRTNCWEKRWFFHGPGPGQANTGMDVFLEKRARFTRRLAANEGLFLFLELHPNSAAFTGQNFMNLWCRTLVTDTNRT